MAVLFADIEGCTRLCEDLPPRAMARVIERYFSRFLDVVRSEGGEVTEILGDGLLALFEGRNLKNDAARALSAASGEHRVYSAVGPVTNVAARLCTLASRGQLLVTDAVARRLDGAYPARRLGPRKLKNVSDPVEVFEIGRPA